MLNKLFNYNIIMGIFITLEGIDGAGKTTAADALAVSLKELGYKVLLTNEPTDGYLGTVIKDVILGVNGKLLSESKEKNGQPDNPPDKKTLAVAALFLFSADRVIHLNEIASKLKDLDIIICDRFVDSTYAYQAVYSTGKEDRDFEDTILGINDFVLRRENIFIDRTYLFDIEPEAALKRLHGRAGKLDGFDGESLDFFKRVRNNYLYLAEIYKNRIKNIDAAAKPNEVHSLIMEDITAMINDRNKQAVKIL